MKETFIDPLLHPYSTPSPTSPTYEEFPAESPRGSIDYLPIASRFLSPTPWSDAPSAPQPQDRRDDHPNIDGESLNSDEEDEADDRLGKGYLASRKTGQMSLGAKHNHPRSPYGRTATRTPVGKHGVSVPFPSRSHQSLPPAPRANPMASSTQSLGRQSVHDQDQQSGQHPPRAASSAANSSRVLRKFKKSNPTPPPVAVGGAVSPNQLPEDLKKCLEVIEGGILEGHRKLHEGLKRRYEDQYPLVRSLADVFVANVSPLLCDCIHGCLSLTRVDRSRTSCMAMPLSSCTWSVRWNRWTMHCRLPA